MHATMAYEAVEVWFHTFLNSALEGGEWTDSELGRFVPLEKTGGLAPQLVWTIREGKYIYPLQGIETRSFSWQSL